VRRDYYLMGTTKTSKSHTLHPRLGAEFNVTACGLTATAKTILVAAHEPTCTHCAKVADAAALNAITVYGGV